jgi:hypothetical protein
LVMFGLVQGAMELSGDGTAMFADCVALAFFAHTVRAYGGVPAGRRNARGGLASSQLQRARDFINTNLADDPSISQVASDRHLAPTPTPSVPPFGAEFADGKPKVPTAPSAANSWCLMLPPITRRAGSGFHGRIFHQLSFPAPLVRKPSAMTIGLRKSSLAAQSTLPPAA